MAVRLQAAAELSAGASLSLGLSVGDFIELVKQDPAMDGIPYRLFEIFLEEVTIGAGLYAKASLSAMAYANLAITGSLMASDRTSPGFTVMAEAGAGLKAGAGYRVFAEVGIDDVRRMMGRTTDVLVDEVFTQIGQRIPGGDRHTQSLLDAARVPAKIALRTAYEIGELISTRTVHGTESGQAVVSQRCVQIILEETQRYIFGQVLGVAFQDLERSIRALGLAQVEWDRLHEVRSRLGSRLKTMPADPFALTTDAVAYWQALIGDAAWLIDELGSRADAWRLHVSILWSAMELMFAAARRMLDQAAAADAANLAPAAVHAAFTGPVQSAPPASVLLYINQTLGRDTEDPLQREDLVVFLTDDVILHELISKAPGVEKYLEIFESFPGGRRQFMRDALGNLGAIRFQEGGEVDPTRTLVTLSAPLRTFLHTTVQQQLAPAIRPHLQGRGDLALYFDEVILPSMAMTVDVAFERAQRWAGGTVDQDALTEALSSVLLSTLGRSLVVTSDVLITNARSEVQRLFIELADRVDDPGGLADVLKQAVPATSRMDVVETVQEVLRIGSAAFAPLPSSTRAKMRHLLYGTMGATLFDDASSFAASLEDPMLMPSQQITLQLAEELGKTAVQSIEDFVREMLRRLARRVLDAVKAQIDHFVQMVEEWVEDIRQAALWLRSRVQELMKQVALLVKALEQRLVEVANEVQKLLGVFSQASFRTSVRNAIVVEVLRTAEVLLEGNAVYKHVVPSKTKAAARQAMRDALSFGIEGSLATPLWNALGAISFEANQLITEVRGFDPSRGIGQQLRDLIIRRAENAIRYGFGANAGINLKFSVSWTVWTPAGDKTLSTQIDLGRIDLPVNDLIRIVRAVLEPLAVLDSIVQPLSNRLATMFQAETQLAQVSTQADQVRVQADLAEQIEEQFGTVMASYIDVAIIEPAPAAIYETNVPLRIDLAGAPLSFLGRNSGEQQRVIVWLNEKILDLGTMDATMVSASEINKPAALAGHTVIPGITQPSVVSSPIPPFNPARHLSPATAVSTTHDVRSTATPKLVDPAGAAGELGIAPVLAAYARALAPSRAEPVPARSHGARDGASFNSLVANGDDLAGWQTEVPSVPSSIGVKPTAMELLMLDVVPVDVLRVTGTLRLDSLVEGVNTIVVAITDGMGRRVEKVASFLVAPLLADRQDGGVRLPPIILDADMHLVEAPGPLNTLRAADRAMLMMPGSARADLSENNLKVIDQMRETAPTIL